MEVCKPRIPWGIVLKCVLSPLVVQNCILRTLFLNSCRHLRNGHDAGSRLRCGLNLVVNNGIQIVLFESSDTSIVEPLTRRPVSAFTIWSKTRTAISIATVCNSVIPLPQYLLAVYCTAYVGLRIAATISTGLYSCPLLFVTGNYCMPLNIWIC